MKVKEVMNVLESAFPLACQEDYDNAGLICGNPESDVIRALVSLDLTPEVVHEAVARQCGMVISHHPFIFKGIKKIIADTPAYEIIREAMAEGISLYAVHTNLDNSYEGLNHSLCDKLGLTGCRILAPKKGLLFKLVTFCPVDHAARVRTALFEAGAGRIGNYDSCSYNMEGFGTFRAKEDAKPFVGQKNVLHQEPEVRIEVIFPRYLEDDLICALKLAHPYEEVAYDVITLDNPLDQTGSGMSGTLDKPVPASEIFTLVKKVLNLPVIRHSGDPATFVKKISLCTGAGAFLIPDAIRAGSGLFLTGDLKYHDFHEFRDRILLADIGHYESENGVKELISELLIQKIPNFAVALSETEKNPVRYF